MADIADSISEEYYQISEALLSSFPKYRPPLDLFMLKESTGQLLVYSKKDTRLSNAQVEEIQALCADGNLFVSRSDHPVYSRHIAKQLDLVLVDQNLKEGEIADICIQALCFRLDDFFDQPVLPAFERLYSDAMVLCEYLWADMHRLKLFMRRLHLGQHSLAHHSCNTLFVGLWLYTNSTSQDTLNRKSFEQATTSLLLHDVGMTKVPAFIVGKKTPLRIDEKEKIPPHTLAGYKILMKLEQTYDMARQAVMEHHERLDGSGYPQKIKEISTFGKITAVADAFSAMIQTRPYAPAKAPAAAARELADDTTHFDKTYTIPLLAAVVTESFLK